MSILRIIAQLGAEGGVAGRFAATDESGWQEPPIPFLNSQARREHSHPQAGTCG